MQPTITPTAIDHANHRGQQTAHITHDMSGLGAREETFPAAVALFDFAGMDDTDLAFTEGDIITVHDTGGLAFLGCLGLACFVELRNGCGWVSVRVPPLPLGLPLVMR